MEHAKERHEGDLKLHIANFRSEIRNFKPAVDQRARGDRAEDAGAGAVRASRSRIRGLSVSDSSRVTDRSDAADRRCPNFEANPPRLSQLSRAALGN